MPAIFLSSAAPISAGTRFQIRIANTTTIASAIHCGAPSPKAVGSGWCSGAPAWAAALWCSAIRHRPLDRACSLGAGHGNAREPPHHLLRRLGCDSLNLAERGGGGGADALFRSLDHGGIGLVGGSDPVLGRPGAPLLGRLGMLQRLRPGSLYPGAIGDLGLLGAGSRRLRRREVVADALVARLDSRLDLRQHRPADPEID